MNINWSWVNNQLNGSETTQQLSTSVKRLLETLESMNLDDDALREVLEKFHRLGLGYTIIPDRPEERWEQCLPGNYMAGDTVRVKPDAYEGAKSTLHNGKRGRVAGSRGGNAIVIYDDAENSEQQWYHHPDVLERLI